MFTQSDKSPEAQEPIGRTATGTGRSSGEPSIISGDLKVVGNLHCAGDIQVKGNVEGDIRSRTVTIGEGAHVDGSIAADTVHISGSIKGQVEAPSITVAKGAKVVGDLIHETLSVEAGAFVEGSCRRLDTKKAAQPASASPVKPVKPEAAAPAPKAARAP